MSHTVDEGLLAQGLLEAAPDAILVTDSDGIIVLVNRQAERSFGYTRAELLGQPIEVLVPDEHRTAHVGLRTQYAERSRLRSMTDGDAPLRGRRKDGTTFPVEVGLSPLETPAGRRIIAIARDVTRRTALEEQLRFLGSHDPMTGLFNRAFYEAEKTRLDQSREPVGVLMLDIDGLKTVNDHEGHEAGDHLIKRVAAVLRTSFRPEDMVARIGGDEFAVLLPGLAPFGLDDVVRRLRADLARHNELHRGAKLSFSIGAALAPGRGTLEAAVRTADRRMYADKRTKAAARGGGGAPSSDPPHP